VTAVTYKGYKNWSGKKFHSNLRLPKKPLTSHSNKKSGIDFNKKIRKNGLAIPVIRARMLRKKIRLVKKTIKATIFEGQ
jgi:hypothetical protein